MKAVYLLGKDSLDMREVPEPGITGADEVLVKTDELSVCTTDTEIIRGEILTKKLPIIIGHEASGKVVSIAGGVKNIKEGDRVIIDPNFSDFTCEACRLGLGHLCANGGLMGREVDGVFRELLALPSRNLHKLPPQVPARVSPLIQPLSTAVHAIKRAEVAPGSSVLVLGLGVTGLMLTQLAKLRGALVIATSTVRRRLDIAKSLGADATLNRSEGSLVPEVMEITQNRGVDVVIHATSPLNPLVNDAARALRPRGTVLLFSTGPTRLEFDSYQAYLKELTIRASRSSQPEDFEEAIQLVANGKIDLGYQVTASFPFGKTVEAISFFKDRTNVLRTIIVAGS